MDVWHVYIPKVQKVSLPKLESLEFLDFWNFRNFRFSFLPDFGILCNFGIFQTSKTMVLNLFGFFTGKQLSKFYVS